MSKTKKIVLLAAVGCVVAGLILVGIAACFIHFDFSKLSWSSAQFETVTYPVTEPFHNITLRGMSYDVRLLPSEDGTCRMVSQESERVRIAVEVTGDTLTVTQTDTSLWYEHIVINFGSDAGKAITLYLPDDIYGSLAVKTVSGNIEVPDAFSFSDARLISTSGEITCTASTQTGLEVQTTSGDIRLKNANGAVTVSTTSGDVRLSDTEAAKLNLSSTSGDFDLSNLTADRLSLSTTSGELSLSSVVVAGEAQLNSVSGDIEFSRCDAASLTIKTTSGEVEGTLLSPKNFAVKTTSGDIDLPPSDPSAGSCSITTVSGDIDLEVIPAA